MPAGAGGRGGTDGSVDDAKRFGDGAVGRRDEAEPNHLEETLVDDGALVQRRAAVAQVVRDRGVGIARLGQADVIGIAREGSAAGARPAWEAALPVVRPPTGDGGGYGGSIPLRQVGAGHEAGHLGRDRWSRRPTRPPPTFHTA